MVLKVCSFENSATSTLQSWALVYGYTGGPWANNVEVSHIDLSLADPTAIMELKFGRVGVASNPGTGSASTYFDAVGNNAAGNSSGLVSYSPIALSDFVGQYFIQGGEALQLDFPTPIEAFKISQDWAFAFTVRLVGSSAGTADGWFHLNIWFSEA
jgi:hypothetical protein